MIKVSPSSFPFCLPTPHCRYYRQAAAQLPSLGPPSHTQHTISPVSQHHPLSARHPLPPPFIIQAIPRDKTPLQTRRRLARRDQGKEGDTGRTRAQGARHKAHRKHNNAQLPLRTETPIIEAPPRSSGSGGYLSAVCTTTRVAAGNIPSDVQPCTPLLVRAPTKPGQTLSHPRPTTRNTEGIQFGRHHLLRSVRGVSPRRIRTLATAGPASPGTAERRHHSHRLRGQAAKSTLLCLIKTDGLWRLSWLPDCLTACTIAAPLHAPPPHPRRQLVQIPRSLPAPTN